MKEVIAADLFAEIMAAVFRDAISDLEIDAAKLVEAESYQGLQRIQAVLCDDSLSDRQCFMRIEAIVAVFEAGGSTCGNRHDFG